MRESLGEGADALGVVVPTLNEESTLPDLVADLRDFRRGLRVIVADGGSGDGTVQVARTLGIEAIAAPRGRAAQMNVGARALATDWLLFLHADSRFPRETGQAVDRWLANPPVCEAAHFAFRLDTDRPWRTIIERGQRLRERLTGLAYGDQGLLVSRRRFEQIGGIPEIPVMEDVEAVRRLRRTGGLDRIDAPILTSARRYVRERPLIAWLRNAALILLYSAGVPPRHLARWYPSERPRGRERRPPSRRIVTGSER